jgi:hypothetical protein
VPTRKEPELGALAIREWEWANTWLVFAIFNILVNLVGAHSRKGSLVSKLPPTG